MIVGMKVFRREKRWKLEKKNKIQQIKKKKFSFCHAFRKLLKIGEELLHFPYFIPKENIIKLQKQQRIKSVNVIKKISSINKC